MLSQTKRKFIAVSSVFVTYMCHASQTQQLSRQSGNGSLSRQSFGALATCQVPMSFWHVGSARGTKNRHVGIAPILRSRCFAQLDNMLLDSPLVKPNPPLLEHKKHVRALGAFKNYSWVPSRPTKKAGRRHKRYWREVVTCSRGYSVEYRFV